MNIIFLDIDGVLNCQLLYEKSNSTKRKLKKAVKKEEVTREDYYKSQICPERIGWLNDLCADTNSVVVVSSSWRIGQTVEELQNILNNSGATFKIVDKTPNLGYERGVEISKWLKDNIKPETHGVHYFDFHSYVIIDDDSDMLLNQRENFFQTDTYSGLTPNICYRIKRFFNKKYFPNND